MYRLIFYCFIIGILCLSCVMHATADSGYHQIEPGDNLVVGINKNFSPYEYINSAGKAEGYTVELIKEVAKNLGVTVSFVLDDWAAIKDGLEKGKLDLVGGMLYSEDRDKTFDYSISHSTISYSLFVRKGSPIRKKDDLKSKQLIVVEDVYAHERLKKRLTEAELIPVNSSTDGLKLLASGSHDGLILPRLHGLSLLQQLQITNVEVIGPGLLEQKFAFAVTENNSGIRDDINEALFTLQLSGIYEKIYLKWFSVEEEKKSFKRFLKFLVPIAILTTVLFIIFITWNWALRQAVAKKTADIEQARGKLHEILEGVPLPTYVVDCDGSVIHWNRACQILTGQSEEMVIGTKEYEKILYPENTKSICALLLAGELSKETHQYNEITYRKSRLLNEAYEANIYFQDRGIDGQWFYISGTILRDNQGNRIGAIESLQDITEIKLLERQLIQSQKMEALGTLAGGISHDFNNILSSIIGSAEIATLKFGDNPDFKKYLDLILAGGRQGKDLTSQILAFSSKATINPQLTSVTTVVEETMALLKSTCPHNIAQQSNIKSTTEIVADPTHIHQVVMNLCTNAIYAMREDGGKLEVSVEQLNEDNASHIPSQLPAGVYIRLSVADDGPGIEESVQKRIYDPFYTTKERGEGSGMGLSVSAGIIQQYGGIITCQSHIGEGTTFQVYLPVRSEKIS